MLFPLALVYGNKILLFYVRMNTMTLLLLSGVIGAPLSLVSLLLPNGGRSERALLRASLLDIVATGLMSAQATGTFLSGSLNILREKLIVTPPLVSARTIPSWQP